MPAGKYNFKLEEGATFNTVITWEESDSPIDNTGYTARMTIRNNNFDGAVILELTTENGRIVLGGADGQITLNVDAADTEALDFASGAYDLEMINGDGDVVRLIEGVVTYKRNVTT